MQWSEWLIKKRNENVHVKREVMQKTRIKGEGSEPRRKVRDLRRYEQHLQHYVLRGHPVS